LSPRSVFRAVGRFIVVVAVMAFVTIVGVQYARIIERNVALAHTLAQVNDDIGTLKTGREQRLAHIRRLEDPQGAIPEIHDRLHMLKPNESIIYWKGATPIPEPTP
jgi:hypothetical protein